ncbi:MAG TPA: hypothetical protein VF411_11860 [Bacteroidia bacterium]
MKTIKRKFISSIEAMTFKRNKMQHEFYWHDEVQLQNKATGVLSLDYRMVFGYPEVVEIDFIYVDCKKKYPIEYITTVVVYRPTPPQYIDVPFNAGNASRLLWKVIFKVKSKKDEVHMTYSIK